MEDGKVYASFRTFLFININQSFVTGNLLSCSRSLQTLVDGARPTLFHRNNNLLAIEDSHERED